MSKLYSSTWRAVRGVALMGLPLLLGACGGGSGSTDQTATPVETPAQPAAVIAPVTTAGTVTSAASSATVATVPAATVAAVTTPRTSSKWGTAARPFAANSPWNSRPINPTLTDIGIPSAQYFPAVQAGAYSTGVFTAAATDGPMEVVGHVGSSGVWNPDAQQTQPSVTLPRWPSAALPATGSDGHCDIVDPIAGVIHSFWQLKNDAGVWRARQYAWTSLKGRGWGDPAHYFQGARAAAVPSSGGLIRSHEVGDGDIMFRHALAMSLTYNGLSATTTHVFPATSADTTAATTNTGSVPEGALMMLPQTYDTSTIASPKLRRVAETLKRYGAYVVDRNYGTPFVIYAEIGADFDLHEGGWNHAVGLELERIRQALRMVGSASSWVDGDGRPTSFNKNLNMLSMRGPWRLQTGAVLGVFNTLKQAVEFPALPTKVVQVNNNGTGLSKVSWAPFQAGMTYKITAKTTGGGQFRFVLNHCTDKTQNIDTGVLDDAASYQFVWPASYCYSSVYAINGVNQASTVSASLVKMP